MTTQALRRTRGHVVGVTGHVYKDVAPRYVNHRGRPISRNAHRAYQLASVLVIPTCVLLVMLVIVQVMAMPS